MHDSLSLNGEWGLAYTDDTPLHYVAEQLPGKRLLPAAVPAPIHQVLMDHGLLDDPRLGLNALRARWVEEQFWIYRRTFDAPEAALGVSSWLVFEKLEYDAIIYLNGVEVGRHANAHRPARIDVTGKLRAGENVLAVRLETGLFADADKPGAEYRSTPQSLLSKIHWQRKGQWQRGWDWQQRLMNVGILGDVHLEWGEGPVVLQTQVFAVPSPDLAEATFTARVAVLNPEKGRVLATLRIEVPGAFAHVRGFELPTGESIQEVSLPLESPQLWWPIGHGEQHRYRVKVTFTSSSDQTGTDYRVERWTGVRKVEVDQSPHPVEGRHFILKINDRPIFCKGGNWVPADMLYSTVTPERYRELVDLAIGANFNMLRIWGGGIFADSALLDYCDEKGILVWHDLLFACSKYPGDFPDFAAEVRREVTWAVREMAHHPSLVVWCGNNEVEEADWNWGWDRFYRTHPHYALFHHDLPQIVTREDPSKFYWISSPYSPDYKNPTDPTVGDQHPWGVSLRQPGGADWWDYRKYVDRFPNEGGVLGASSLATLRQFLPENERYLLSPSWEYHDNPFALNGAKPGDLGRAYQTVALWTGRDPLTMDWEEYAFASALLQAEGLTEYISNYRRRMFSSAAAIFWMYNDSWPATHGWTIVDYYRRKKLAYHPVRRAFAPVTVVVAEEGGVIGIYGINETQHEWRGDIFWGWCSFSGENTGGHSGREPVTLPPNSSSELTRFPLLDEVSLTKEFAYASLYDDREGLVAQNRQFFARFDRLDLVPNPHITLMRGGGRLVLVAEAFVWGVCLDVDGEAPLADNCFDLLPGIPYTLPWPDELGEPRIVRTGNQLFHATNE